MPSPRQAPLTCSWWISTPPLARETATSGAARAAATSVAFAPSAPTQLLLAKLSGIRRGGDPLY
jgi:hypothetical protein